LADSTRVYYMQESLSGICDLPMRHTQPVFTSRCKQIDLLLLQAQSSSRIFNLALSLQWCMPSGAMINRNNVALANLIGDRHFAAATLRNLSKTILVKV
jgi:hypothetical protein